MSRTLLPLSMLFCFSPVVPAAEPTVFDRVPFTARLVLGVRNLDELKEKGDRFLKDVDWEPRMKPSDLFSFMTMISGLGEAPDPQKGIAFALVAEDFLEPRPGWLGWRIQLVAIFPFDGKRVQEKWGIDAKKFKEGETIDLGNSNSNILAKYLTLRDGFAYVGEFEKGVKSVAESKRLADELTPEQRKVFGTSDVFLALIPGGFKPDERSDFARDLAKSLIPEGDPLADTEFGTQFRDACEALKYGLASFRVEKGLSLRLAGVFEKGGKAKKFLQTLGAGPNKTDLDGLPEGNVVFAQSVRGDGAQTAAFARGFLHALLNSYETTKQLLAENDEAIYLGVFNEIWKRLKGTRVGLYHNARPEAHGLLSGVAIVETDDATDFVKELRKLAKFSVSEAEKALPKDEIAEIERLIRDLSDDRFRVRESATSKLMLIGLPAIQHLDRAIKNGDADLVARATKVRESIAKTIEARRKEPRTEGPLRPTFGFVEKPATADGVEIETLVVRTAREDAAVTKELRQLFGPRWDRVKVAPLGKQAVFLFGSNDELLTQTLANLKEKKPGLAKADFLPDFVKHSQPNKKMEIHFSIDRLSGLMTGDIVRESSSFRKATVTSVGLTVKDDSLQFDGWLPSSEFKAFRKSQGW